jgi:hypothetical protein
LPKVEDNLKLSTKPIKETKMSKTETYRKQLRNLRKGFYSKGNPTIKEIMEFSVEEIYLVKKMSGKF